MKLFVTLLMTILNVLGMIGVIYTQRIAVDINGLIKIVIIGVICIPFFVVTWFAIVKRTRAIQMVGFYSNLIGLLLIVASAIYFGISGRNFMTFFGAMGIGFPYLANVIYMVSRKTENVAVS
jgi:hypothetical protein